MKCGIMWSHIVLVSLALWQIGSCISIDNCPDNLEQNKYLKAFGDKCYFFYLFINREYNGAQGVCREKGGNLVSIKSARMNSYLLDQLRNFYEYGGNIWIGLSDQADEKHYVWRDGSAMGYSNFESDTGPDTPWWDITDRVQDCISMSPWSGEWEDLDCGDNIINNHHHAFICEYDPKPKQPPTTTTTTTTTTTMTTTTTLPPTTANTTTTTIPPPPPTTTSTPPPPTATTVKASTTSAPASSNDTSTAAATCPPIVCSKDCGMLGFATDKKTGCMMCECQEE